MLEYGTFFNKELGMILAVMSLRQWMEANKILNVETQTLDYDALRAALDVLEITQIQILLLASNADDMQQFLTFAGSSISNILYVKPVADDSEETYTEAVRQAHRQLAPRSVVSFSPYLQQIPEFTHLSFANPGQSFQYYFQWVDSYLPVHPTQKTIVMAVGEVVRQDRSAAAPVLSDILAIKNIGADISDLVAKMFSLILEQEHGPEGYIYQFKMGFMAEEIFDQRMIDSFAEKLGIQLSIEEFNQIWQATNPTFSEIQPLLSQIDAQELQRNGYSMVFLAYTNRKDMRRLHEELQQHDQAYVSVNGDLIGFAGVPLACSFMKQNSTLEMLQEVTTENSYPQSYQLAESPKKMPQRPIYWVSSELTLTEKLAAINAMPNVSVCLGWDGSSLHEWIEQNSANVAEEQFAGARRRSESMATF